MTNSLTSRERMRRAIQLQEVDHVPCAFMSFTALRRKVNEDLYELARRELALGLDSFLFIPSAGRPLRPEHPELRGLPVRFHPAVQTVEWQEVSPLSGQPVRHKRYLTPAGELSTAVRWSEDWPHGEHIPFIDDFQVSRAVQPLVKEASDLEALQFLLTPPTAEDRAAYQAETARAHAFTDQQQILLASGWGVGVDMAVWLCGVQEVVVKAMTEPAFVARLLEMIHNWNLARMKVVLEGKPDLYIRRAWYEGCDFLTPRAYRQLVLPLLKKEVELAHEHGVKFGYICTSGLLPLLDQFLEAEIDVLIGVDPVQGTYTDLAQVKAKLNGRMSAWGGVSGAVTVELGSPAEIRAAVKKAIEQLGPTGLILSPVDNITVDSPQTWANLETFLEAWRQFR